MYQITQCWMWQTRSAHPEVYVPRESPKGSPQGLGLNAPQGLIPMESPKAEKKGSSNRINLQFSQCPGAIYEKLFTLRIMESKPSMPHPGFTYCYLNLGLHIVDLIVCIKCLIFSEKNIKKVQPSS